MCSAFLLAVGGNIYYCNTILLNTSCFSHMCPCILLVLDLCKAEVLFKVRFLNLVVLLGIIQANTGWFEHICWCLLWIFFMSGTALCLSEEHQKDIPKRLVRFSGV